MRRLAGRIIMTRFLDGQHGTDYAAGLERAEQWIAAERAALQQKRQSIGDVAELKTLITYCARAKAG